MGPNYMVLAVMYCCRNFNKCPFLLCFVQYLPNYVEIVSLGKAGTLVMFKSGFEVDMIGLTPLLSPSAAEEEDWPSAFAVMPAVVKTNARRRAVRTNTDFNCFMFME